MLFWHVLTVEKRDCGQSDSSIIGYSPARAPRRTPRVRRALGTRIRTLVPRATSGQPMCIGGYSRATL